MRVRARVGKEHHLTREKEYIVLGLDDKYFRVLDDDGLPALYPRRAFDVIDGAVPDGWVWRWGDEGDFYADPPELCGRGFYERYFEHDEEAVSKFKEYVTRNRISSLNN